MNGAVHGRTDHQILCTVDSTKPGIEPSPPVFTKLTPVVEDTIDYKTYDTGPRIHNYDDMMPTARRDPAWITTPPAFGLAVVDRDLQNVALSGLQANPLPIANSIIDEYLTRFQGIESKVQLQRHA